MLNVRTRWFLLFFNCCQSEWDSDLFVCVYLGSNHFPSHSGTESGAEAQNVPDVFGELRSARSPDSKSCALNKVKLFFEVRSKAV